MRLVWFRNDLRLADNPALRHACAGDEPVAALFIVSPTQWQTHKLAPVRQRFMLAQVDAMGRELAARGIPLHLLRVETFAEVPTALTALCRELGVSQLLSLIHISGSAGWRRHPGRTSPPRGCPAPDGIRAWSC